MGKAKAKDKQKTTFLDRLERAGNSLPNPAILFVILTLITMVLSAILAAFDVAVSYEALDSATGELVTKHAAIINLLSGESLRHFLTSIIGNFTGFFPLGTVFTVILGVGVAEGTGMLQALIKKAAQSTPKSLVTAMVVFIGIMSNVASSTGYVVLVPLGAILFMGFGRHPIAGLAAAFAGVSGGWSANLLIGSNDPMFAGMSTQAANQLDPSYTVLPTGNWYFMIASTFLITLIGTLVTDKIIEPRLGKYEGITEDVSIDVSEDEKRGLKYAGISALVYIGLLILTIIPPFGIFLDPEGGNFTSSPFMKGIIVIFMLLFLIPGIFYGIGAKKIKSSHDVVELMNQSISGLSSFLVLIFFAAQFTAQFNYSNMGTCLSVAGANFLQNIGLVGIPLLVLYVLVTAFINIFIAVDSAKWALMAPIFVPMFMRLGMSPELTQAAYRIGDSSTNIIAPLMPFFVLIVAFAQKYDKKAGIGTLMSTMLPYSLFFLVGWILLLIVWMLLGLPLGPGAPLTYPG